MVELENATGSNEDKMTILMSKIKLLGQEYIGSPHCFPVGNCILYIRLFFSLKSYISMYIFFNIFFYICILDFLVKQLEFKACKYKVSNISIITGFLELGIAMEDLLDIYDK